MTAPKPKTVRNGFKTRIGAIERDLRKKNNELTKVTSQEKRARGKWTKGYASFLAAARQLTNLKIHKTQKEERIKNKIKAWPEESSKLTKERDALRDTMAKIKEAIIVLETKLAMLHEQELNESKTTDEIVTQVFSLNQTVVNASHDREECLKRHVFPRLFDEDGNLRSQLSFTSSDGLRRVVAMVNTMTIVKGDLAAEAKKKIEQFFDRFREAAEVKESVKALYDLTRQILVEKIDFKVGPDLYRFISMEIDAAVFPELADAQALLRKSIQSEKTNSYIRIYSRTSTAANWEVVPQS